MDKLIEGLIWVGPHHSHGVRIASVTNGMVTFEISEKLNDGPDYYTFSWGFKGTLKILTETEFRKQYEYDRLANLEHEHEVAEADMKAAAALLLSHLDDPGAAALVELFAKTVLNEAALRIERAEWDEDRCDTDSFAAKKISTDLSDSEAALLHQ